MTKKIKIMLLWTLILGTMPLGVQAIQQFDRDEFHRGIQTLGEFHIFPEQRQGNALYFQKKLLISDPEQTILDAYTTRPDIPATIFLSQNAESELQAKFIDQSDQKKIELIHIGDEFYQILDRATGKSKLFRVFKNRLDPILPQYKTLKGSVLSKDYVAFYHIFSSKPLPAPRGGREYFFRIHVMPRMGSKLRSFKHLIIRDTLTTMNLFWETQSILGYRLADGTTRYLNVTDKLPKARPKL